MRNTKKLLWIVALVFSVSGAQAADNEVSLKIRNVFWGAKAPSADDLQIGKQWTCAYQSLLLSQRPKDPISHPFRFEPTGDPSVFLNLNKHENMTGPGAIEKFKWTHRGLQNIEPWKDTDQSKPHYATVRVIKHKIKTEILPFSPGDLVGEWSYSRDGVETYADQISGGLLSAISDGQQRSASGYFYCFVDQETE